MYAHKEKYFHELFMFHKLLEKILSQLSFLALKKIKDQGLKRRNISILGPTE